MADVDDRGDAPVDPPEPQEGWPWSFLLLVAAGGIYLVFRFVELIVKLVG